MKAIIKSLSLTAFIMVLLFSCKREDVDTVNQNNVYRKYVVKYSDKTGDLSTQATFRYNRSSGTRLRLTGNSSIEYSSNSLFYNSSYAYYSSTTYGFIGNGEFQWTDVDGVLRTTQAEIYPASIPSNLKYLSRFYNYDVEIIGNPVQNNETIKLIITDSYGVSRVFYQSSFGSNYIRLDRENLNDLSPGAATVSIEREREFNIYDTSSGGKVQVQYESALQYIEIMY